MVGAMVRVTLLMFVRRRVPVVGILFLLLLGAAATRYLESDHTLLGMLRLLLTTQTLLASSIVTLLMIYLASTALDTEFREETITLLATKPIARWKILLAKWLALILLGGWILLLSACLTYVLLWLHRTPPLPSTHFCTRLQRFLIPNANQPSLRQEDRSQSQKQFFTCRRSYRPRLPTLEEEIQRYRIRLREEGRLDEAEWDDDYLRVVVADLLRKKLYPIRYRAEWEFLFCDLPLTIRTTETTIRYKLYGMREKELGGWLRHAWRFHHPLHPYEVFHEDTSKSGTTREFRVNSLPVGEDGSLRVTLINQSGPVEESPPATIYIPLEEGIELLAPTGAFEWNYLRGWLLLWIRFAMLAAIGVAGNTFLSGPVTAFLLLGVVTIGTLHTGVLKTIAPPPTPWVEPAKTIEARAYRIFAAFLRLLPNFSETDPTIDLAAGREIPWWRLLKQFGCDVGLRAGIFLLAGFFSFYRKEVGIPPD